MIAVRDPESGHVDQKRLSWASDETNMLLTKEIATLPLWQNLSSWISWTRGWCSSTSTVNYSHCSPQYEKWARWPKRLSWGDEVVLLLTKDLATLSLWHCVGLQTFCQEDNLLGYVEVYRMVLVGQKNWSYWVQRMVHQLNWLDQRMMWVYFNCEWQTLFSSSEMLLTKASDCDISTLASL